MRSPLILACCLTVACAGAREPERSVAPQGPAPVSALPRLPTRSPVGDPPADLLEGTGLESCGVYRSEQCVDGTRRQCALYDTGSAAWVDSPDPLLNRTLLYDRWYDLYHQPGGVTAERLYKVAMPAGTDESVWADPANLDHFTGLEDGAIWNGAALVAATLRYMATGTEADYARMEKKTRDLVLQFEITGVPGYIARYHFLVVEPGAPQTNAYVVRQRAPGDHTFTSWDPSGIKDAPEVVTEGYVDAGGKRWTGTPWLLGNPSIDQNTGPRIALPMAYHLLRDERLRQRIAYHLTCYLNRLQRIEIRNIQESPAMLEGMASFLSTADTNLDAGDIDFMSLDTIVVFGHLQINSTNANLDWSCPETISLEPDRVIDAASPEFMTDALALALDLRASSIESPTGLNHAYVPSVRGPDAIHMMHLATIAYHFTGDDSYRRFLYEDLIGRHRAIDVAHTAGVYDPPRFCRSFYGHHIAFSPTWAFLRLLDESELRTELLQVFEGEFWQKEMHDQANAKFDLMYAGEVPAEIATADVEARDEAIRLLRELGGNAGVLDDPRRNYAVDPQTVIDRLPDFDNAVLCPTEEEVEECEGGYELLGYKFGGRDVTFECTGATGECRIGDRCVMGQTRDALPLGLRRYADFAWQRNPYEIGHQPRRPGRKQSPGLDLTESYWLARFYGFITEGDGQVLAWRDVEACDP